MSYLWFSKKISNYIVSNTDIPRDKEVVLTYGVEILTITLGNIVSIIILGKLLGVLPGTIACLITAFLFRHTSGGAHSNSPWICAIITATIFPLIAVISNYFMPISDILSIVSLFICLIAILLFAPVDSSNAPIISPIRRKRLKLASLFVLVLISFIMIHFRQSVIQVCISLTLLWISLMLTSYGHRFIALIDILFTLRRKEV